MTLAPPSWYPDPADVTLVRYWDGSQWTEKTAQAPRPASLPGRRDPVPDSLLGAFQLMFLSNTHGHYGDYPAMADDIESAIPAGERARAASAHGNPLKPVFGALSLRKNPQSTEFERAHAVQAANFQIMLLTFWNMYFVALVICILRFGDRPESEFPTWLLPPTAVVFVLGICAFFAMQRAAVAALHGRPWRYRFNIKLIRTPREPGTR